MGYDVIGDIHGHAEELVALLGTLGYRHHLGAWRHPDRTAIFVGDFIDRGPRQLDTIRIVREMLDAGTAQAVMGNHEFNAIAWYMPDPECDDEHLRRGKGKNHKQHAAFLAETEEDPALHTELVGWFLDLPLWLHLAGLRVVHACWHRGHMAELEPKLKPGRKLDPALVAAASRRGSMEFRTVETLTKASRSNSRDDTNSSTRPDTDEPTFVFDGGIPRRTRFARLRSSARPIAPRIFPTRPIPESARIGYAGPTPVFFGHYWWTGEPGPQGKHVACVDYSAGSAVRWSPIVGTVSRYWRRATSSATSGRAPTSTVSIEMKSASLLSYGFHLDLQELRAKA